MIFYKVGSTVFKFLMQLDFTCGTLLNSVKSKKKIISFKLSLSVAYKNTKLIVCQCVLQQKSRCRKLDLEGYESSESEVCIVCCEMFRLQGKKKINMMKI